MRTFSLHFALAYSGWEYASPVLGGESFTALAENLQNALWTLGGAPSECRTDSLSAAYRNLNRDAARDITRRYEEFCRHYGMTASRNTPGEAHENGCIEAHNNHLKVALDQSLMMRDDRDFATIADWRRYVDEFVARRNRRREDKVKIELPTLRPLPKHHGLHRTRGPGGQDQRVPHPQRLLFSPLSPYRPAFACACL